MNVVILIDGREAIPVRAIPFVTGWWMSPDIVAESFADPDSWRWMAGVPAYQLHAGTISGPLLPKEWDGVVDHLQALDNKLKAKSNDRKQTRPIWLRKSVQLLPPNVFVWKDQFEAYFYRVYSPERLYCLNERPGDRELNFSPLILRPKLRALVSEAFQQLLSVDASPLPIEQPALSDNSQPGAPTLVSDGEGEQVALSPTTTAQEHAWSGEPREVLLKRETFIDAFQRSLMMMSYRCFLLLLGNYQSLGRSRPWTLRVQRVVGAVKGGRSPAC